MCKKLKNNGFIIQFKRTSYKTLTITNLAKSSQPITAFQWQSLIYKNSLISVPTKMKKDDQHYEQENEAIEDVDTDEDHENTNMVSQ